MPSLAHHTDPTRKITSMNRPHIPYLFIAPYFCIFALFGVLPIVYAGYISLHDWTGLREPVFIGVANYTNLLRDSEFWLAARNTLVLLALSGPLTIGGGLALAMLLNSGLVRFRRAYHTLMVLPLVFSLVVAAQVFNLLLANPFGLVNAGIAALGFDKIDFVSNPRLTLPVLTLLIFWKYVGNDLVIMLAGLQAIPRELYEAAQVDGAGRWAVFRHITLPMLRPVILFDIILTTIVTFNMFAEPYTLFGETGGVNQSGLVMGLLMYRTSFNFFKFGYGAAMASAWGLVFFGLSAGQVAIGGRRRES